MATGFNTQTGEGKYRLQFETDDENYFLYMQELARACVDHAESRSETDVQEKPRTYEITQHFIVEITDTAKRVEERDLEQQMHWMKNYRPHELAEEIGAELYVDDVKVTGTQLFVREEKTDE